MVVGHGDLGSGTHILGSSVEVLGGTEGKTFTLGCRLNLWPWTSTSRIKLDWFPIWYSCLSFCVFCVNFSGCDCWACWSCCVWSWICFFCCSITFSNDVSFCCMACLSCSLSCCRIRFLRSWWRRCSKALVSCSDRWWLETSFLTNFFRWFSNTWIWQRNGKANWFSNKYISDNVIYRQTGLAISIYLTTKRTCESV